MFFLVCGLVGFACECVSCRLFWVMASTMPNSPTESVCSDLEIPLALNVVAHVTFYSTSQGSAKGKKVKMVKDNRAKEFRFAFTPSKVNYLAFLQEILNKHNISKFKVSNQLVFPCKVQVPPAR